MLTLALLVLTISGTRARNFNITHLIMPGTVLPEQEEIEIECRYDANFTLLNWFKGPNEFFRYKPGAAPSTRSFPLLGVGRIEMLMCGPTACRLRLGGLTEEATGLYRCDIERNIPPYKFATKSAYMRVYGHDHRRPLIEGFAEEYGEGDEMQAYCKTAPDSEIRWYINGREVDDMKGSATFKKTNSRLYYLGLPPRVTIQCAEFRDGELSGSKEKNAFWKDYSHKDERAQEQRNGSNSVPCLGLMSVFCVIFKQIL